MSKNKMNRRDFLGTASCAAVGSTTFFSTLFNLGMANALAGANRKSSIWTPPDDYKALVCVLFAGGNDSYNMLVPRGLDEYAEYAATRSNLALPQDGLLPLFPATYDAQKLGAHPAMSEVQQLFSEGKLAFLANVGTLVEPTTLAQYNNDSVDLPLGLFSHADQIRQWQTSIPNERASRGWGGKMADILQSMNSNQNISMNISLAGRNVFQSGLNTTEFTIRCNGDGSQGIEGYKETSTIDEIRTAAIDNLLEQDYQDVFKNTYKEVIRNAQDGHEMFSAAVGGLTLNTVFSSSRLSQCMKMVARTIAARETLGMTRQTFFITFGGWDHHDEVLNKQMGMLGAVSKAFGEFNSAMEELNVSDKVTTFTISDFARTLTSNGNGTDHAWGGNTMVMGGAVNGGDIYGTYPSLALNSSVDTGQGVLLPTTSTDEYFAELARWFGVSDNDLSMVLPNIGNFYTPGGGVGPIGFMQ